MLPKELQVEIYNERAAITMRANYLQMTRGWDDLERRGLMNQETYRQRNAAVSSLSESVWNEVRLTAFLQKRETLFRVLPTKEWEKLARQIPTPVQIALMIGAAATFGHALTWQLNPDMQLVTQVDAPSRRSNVRLHSKWINTTVDLRAMKNTGIDPGAGLSVADPFSSIQAFRYEIGVSRSIPFLDIETGFNFVNTTDPSAMLNNGVVSATVSKQLAPSLSAQAAATSPVSRTPAVPAQGTVSINYGLNF